VTLWFYSSRLVTMLILQDTESYPTNQAQVQEKERNTILLYRDQDR
jgi:hypothetical protein